MSEIEILEVQIGDLKNAYNDIEGALNNISEIDGLDYQYRELDIIKGEIDDKRIDLEMELEKLEDEAYYKENEEQLEAEKRREEYEYWKEVI